MRIFLSDPWKEAESFALGRGSQDSISLLLLGGSNPCLPQQLPKNTTKAVRAMSSLPELGKSAPLGAGLS